MRDNDQIIIIIEHRWNSHPEGGRRTQCQNCGASCDTWAVDAGGPFFAADGTPLGHACPPCPLVPESHHTPGPWVWERVTETGSVPVNTLRGPKVLCRWWETIFESTCDDASLIARAPAMRDALEATLLFHAPTRWTDEARARWKELTGVEEATTRVLCDAIRRALR